MCSATNVELSRIDSRVHQIRTRGVFGSRAVPSPPEPPNRIIGLTMPATKPNRTAEHPTEGFRSAVLAPATDRPVRVYLPTDYQPKYAYPLVVVFHAEGECEEHSVRLVPQLSRRNYIVLCLRGPVNLGCRADGRPAFGWGEGQPDRGTKAALAYATSQFSVHPDRVFLMGIGEGATAAYRLGLSMGTCAAGVVALNGRLPKGRVRANQLRILIGHGTANPVVPVTEARRAVTQLTRAGSDVRMNRYATAHCVHADMLGDANRWIMEQITGKSLAHGH
ncbi:putative hydrolase [Gemmata sp. SH-PL17]|nr:putative hydrolase [Gemmata sp. SH-PL17]